MATTTKASAPVDPFESLREAFDTDLIETTSGFSNVAPRHYIQRLIDSGLEYDILRTHPTLLVFGDIAAVTVKTTIVLALPDRSCTIEGVGASGVSDSSDPTSLANAVSAAESVSLKRAMLTKGTGLELYGLGVEAEATVPASKTKFSKRAKPIEQEEEDEEEEEVKPARRSAKPSRASAKWTGDEVVSFGKWKDTPWNEVDGSYISWLANGEAGPNQVKAEKEIERRGDDFDPEEGNERKPTPKTRVPRSGAKTKAGRGGGRFS